MARSTPRLRARDLVARVKSRRASLDPPPEALAELDKIMAHNAKAMNRYARVRAADALEMLRGYGWAREYCSFQRLVRRRYGRTWES